MVVDVYGKNVSLCWQVPTLGSLKLIWQSFRSVTHLFRGSLQGGPLPVQAGAHRSTCRGEITQQNPICKAIFKGHNFIYNDRRGPSSVSLVSFLYNFQKF